MTTETDEYLTLAEAAVELSELRISHRTLLRYAQGGRLDGAKRVSARRWVIPRSTVERIRVEGLWGPSE